MVLHVDFYLYVCVYVYLYTPIHTHTHTHRELTDVFCLPIKIFYKLKKSGQFSMQFTAGKMIEYLTSDRN